MSLFLEKVRGTIERTFLRDVWRTSARFELATDASPWGYGAWLAEFGWACAFCHGGWTEEDCKFCRLELGSCEGQAVWEALAILIAIRSWSTFWMKERCILHVKSDSKAADERAFANGLDQLRG